MDPLQQRIALKIRKKIKDNMSGQYPALTRLLLAMIGPLKTAGEDNPDSAAWFIKRDLYFQLQNLPHLASKMPEKLCCYLPPNITYDKNSATLTHTYTSGNQIQTKLSNAIEEEPSFAFETIYRENQVDQ